MKWSALCVLARELPEVSEGSWYGTPGLKVRDKGFVRLKEDGKSVVFMTENTEEQQALIDSRPKIYFITDHYRGYAAVLARLSALTVREAKIRLERSWRQKATKSLLEKFDA
jgi:hypothetical protein